MATNLTDIIKKVRTALRGEEVRGSIADGLEYCGQISENAKADMEATAASTKEQLSKDIDAKAAAALKSIPESYTELDGSVKQIKEDISNVIRATYNKNVEIPITFNNGHEFSAWLDDNTNIVLYKASKDEKINTVEIKHNNSGVLYLAVKNKIIKEIPYTVESLGVKQNTIIPVNYLCNDETSVIISGAGKRGALLYAFSEDSSIGTPIDFIKAIISGDTVTYRNENTKIIYSAKVVTEKIKYKFIRKATNVFIVSKDGYGDYTSINDAIENAYDVTNEEVYIYLMKGIYEEVLNIYGHKHIRIIGQNKKDCVIVNKTGKYLESTIRADGDFILKNVSVLATMESAGGFLPTDEQKNFGAYALHVDDISSNEKPSVIIDNCYLYSEAHSAIGIGLHKNKTVSICNCVIENKLSENVIQSSPKRSEYGALYCHSDVTQNGVDGNSNNQVLILKNNRLKTNTNTALKLELDWYGNKDGNSSYYGSYYNTCIKNNIVNADLVKIEKWYQNNNMSIKLADSYGNNIASLNG